MPSLIPGFEYDIFISYRQKDNKYDGWVTEFVDNLKKELEATFKEEISVYFDINPHDGLLETHDVDASLKDKLKCLVFIPIISRTYCDPKSFAWEHEFKAFVDQASQDQFGLKVKLPGGNVASRVLPVRIYDLNNTDIKLCETVLGGVLRDVEFIYSEPGVNRPLKSDDDEKINLNKTKYRNQINKVSNAIEEIISGLRTEPVELGKEKPQQREPLEEVKKKERKEVKEKPAKSSKRKLMIGSIALAVLLVIAAILAYPKIFKRDTLDKLRSSGERITVAVMPFQNMTNDTTWNVWQGCMQNELITFLTNFKELKVRQIESINSLLQSKGETNYASLTPSIASIISQKLDAQIFIHGSIKQAGNTVRINAQIIETKTNEPIKSFQIDGASENEILLIIDSLKVMVKNFLIISAIEKEIPQDFHQLISTNSSDAYRYYVYGHNAFYKLDFTSARDWFLKAMTIDSNFVGCMTMLSYAYGNLEMYGEAKKWCLKAYGKKNLSSIQERLFIELTYASDFETPNEEIKYARQLLELDDQSPHFYRRLGNCYFKLFQYDKAIPEFEKTLEIYDKWKTKPMWVWDYIYLGVAYHRTNQFIKEDELYKKAQQYFPFHDTLLYRQAILSLTKGDTIAANQYIEKYISIRKDNSVSEASINTSLAIIYSEAEILDKAEEYYRKALSLEPEKPLRMNDVAYFLIDKDRNLKEGMELVNKALELNPEDYNYMHTKGWGLYKQGKYKEALEILQNSWDLRRQKAIYNHEAFLHLKAAKKAVASQKRTDR
jgi:tetratricopeptide (TPR) repeat protein